MVRRLFRPIMTVTTTLAVMAGALLGVGLWRRAGDTTWCGKAIMAGSMLGDDPGEAHSLIDEQRSACTQQRERQRILFGAMWRKDGPAMAQCGFELARLQILADLPE